jgi:undecaprenyl diphosphate synthase
MNYQPDSKRQPPALPNLPKHIALVMDGNGRWANARGLPRIEGHRAGEAALVETVIGCLEIGVSHLTAYAFSTENWRRSPEEVRFLMGFNREVLRRRRDEFNSWGVRVRWAGRRHRLWSSVISELEEAERLTRKNRALTLTMAVNYGGRLELVDAVKSIAAEVREGKLNPEKISATTMQRHLYVPELPDVDLFLRSSGELRTSNFLPWQASYAEFVASEKLWPDFQREDLWAAVAEYSRRQRRFGAAVDNPNPLQQ